MLRFFLATLCVAAVSCAPLLMQQQDCNTLLQTHTGPVCGALQASGGINYLGIPYAAPPLGELRWASPQPHPAWTEVRNASAFGPGCVQPHHNEDVPKIQSEDCLSLNVFTPPKSCGTNLPIAVWLHGGSFEEGGSSLFFYDGSDFATKQCSIVVNGNYRLGGFGGVFIEGLDGNQGLYDQRAILQWVQLNAAALNADATRVTLWGQSAGAMSVGFHMSSPNSNKLFRAAILQSNVGGYDFKTRKQALTYGKEFMKVLNCTDIACMRNKTTQEVLQGQNTVEEKFSTIVKIILEWRNLACLLPFTPAVLGNEDWPMQPMEAVKQGKTAHIPLLMGTNVADAVLFVGCSKTPIPPIDYDIGVAIAFGDHSPNVLRHYPCHRGTPDAQPEISTLTTDFFFRCPVRRMGLHASTAAPVYSYVFNYSLPFNVFGKECCDDKPCHGVEIPLVMHALGPYSLDSRSEGLSVVMQGLWGDFVRNAVIDEKKWPMFNANTTQELLINPDASLSIKTDMGTECVEVWDKFTPFWDEPGKNPKHK